MSAAAKKILKTGKIIGKVMLWIVGVFLVLDLLIVGLLFVRPVQNFVADFATEKVSEIWGCDLIIGEMYLTPTLNVKLYDCVLRDYRDNDMIRIGSCKTSLLHLTLKPTELWFGTFAVDDAEVVVRKYKGDEKVNIALWAQKLKKKEKPKNVFVMHCDRLHLTNSEFRYVDDEKRRSDSPQSGIIDYGFFQLQNIELDCIDFLVRSDDISAEISRLACSQYSGFNILNSGGRFRINSHHIIYDNAFVVTPNSRLFLDLAMIYDEWNFADFTNTVIFNARIHPSKFGLADIACFAHQTEGMNGLLLFSGDVIGTINDLMARKLYAKFGKNSFIEGNFNLNGITDISNVKLDLDFKRSNIDMADIADFNLPSGKKIALPASIASLHSNQLTGKFKGTLDDFKTELALKSSAGDVKLDMEASSDADNIMRCSANVSAAGVNVGRFLKSDLVGPVTLSAKIDGKFASPLRRSDFVETADVKLHAFVRQCHLKNYPLQNVNVDANYKRKNCEASLLAMDKNVQLVFDGTADFSEELPKYSGELKVDKLTVGEAFAQCATVDSATAAGFDKFISFAQRHHDMNLTLGLLKANIVGNNLDNLSGVIMLDTVVYTQDSRQLKTNTARLIAANIDGVSKYRFTSDILNAYFSTNYELKTVADSLYDVAYGYFPNLLPARESKGIAEAEVSGSDDEERFVTAELETFAIHRLLYFIYPEIRIAPKTQAYIHLSSDTLKDSIYVDCAFFELKNVLRVKNVNAISKEKGKNNLGLAIVADTVSILGEKRNFSFSDIDFKTHIRRNAVDYDLRWRNPAIISEKLSWLAGTFETRSKNYFSNIFTGSELYLKNYLWKFNEDNNISYNSGDIEVNNLLLKSEESRIKVDGKYTKKDNEPLVAEVDNLDISILNSFINGESMKFDGALTAEFSMVRKSGKLLISGKALADKFEFNDTPFGNVSLFALMPSVNRFGFIGGLFDDGDGATKENFAEYTIDNFRSDIDRKIQRATLMGGYTPDRNEFSVKAAMEKLDLGFLEPFLSSFSHHISGDASGELSFIFTPDSAYFDGIATVNHGQLGIKILNTIYTLDNQSVHFNSKGIELKDIQAKDKFDNVATINGYIHHKMFKDMKMKIDVSTKRLLALNTTKSQDMLFYGDGFVGGDISIVSDGQKMSFTSNNLVTQQGTNFVLPIYFSESASESEVISFKKSAQIDQEETEEFSTELDFDFNFQVTPDAIIQLELDPSIGGLMKARIAGPFRLIYNATSGLAINGELAIQSGTFRLTLKDVIDKMLTLQPGGKINFIGPLDNATVNVSGIYKTTASLNEVLPEEVAGSSTRRTPINAYMNLSGPLFNPNVDFSFELPNSTNELSTLFFSTLDTSGIANRTQQFFSLLVLGKFQANNTAATTSDVVTSAVEYTGMELLTNTLNNFLSKNLKYVNVGINYRNADDTHAAEYSVSASTSLYNDRIVIEGSFGYANNKNEVYNNGNNFIGDYSIEYALNEQKNWRVKVFNVTNQFSSLTQTSPYAQGVALIYKQEFNNGQDWKDSWKRSKKKSEEKKGKKEKKKEKKETGDRRQETGVRN